MDVGCHRAGESGFHLIFPLILAAMIAPHLGPRALRQRQALHQQGHCRVRRNHFDAWEFLVVSDRILEFNPIT